MYEKKIPKDLSCGLNIAIEVIGGKWKANLLANISKGIIRPSELHKSIPQASARVLNQQLSELELHGIVEKKIYNVLPPKSEYSLTKNAESVLEVLRAMKSWGEGYKEIFHELTQNSRIEGHDGIANQESCS
ncbi:transcriptional regulator [Flavobacterium noncentrifugens]|uniref:Transcriptional regulator, HxlR family n=1 Tax=Flavobacterium noncentrifugens TaxID=1128970 RepID=A0A1G8YCN1_9FLAO|nr:helix-turn-helix domain-containing protein [Flavobacterium noncentrifugens]GEP51162.1 transcriptional regulator [Flavobacterium noncentrifugens]SDK00184.1 transcriptional regulator, HxlR family [Flavobacterium noncentrifugens]